MIMSNSEPTKALTVRLPISLYQQVRAAAHGTDFSEEVSVAEFIRQALVKSVKSKEKERRVPPSDRNVQAAGPGSWLSGAH